MRKWRDRPIESNSRFLAYKTGWEDGACNRAKPSHPEDCPDQELVETYNRAYAQGQAALVGALLKESDRLGLNEVSEKTLWDHLEESNG